VGVDKAYKCPAGPDVTTRPYQEQWSNIDWRTKFVKLIRKCDEKLTN
jgi:hypothetical protein